MLMDHSIDRDMFLVGEKGSGKTSIVSMFASLLGYQIETISLYKDMSARELFLRRNTDSKGVCFDFVDFKDLLFNYLIIIVF